MYSENFGLSLNSLVEIMAEENIAGEEMATEKLDVVQLLYPILNMVKCAKEEDSSSESDYEDPEAFGRMKNKLATMRQKFEVKVSNKLEKACNSELVCLRENISILDAAEALREKMQHFAVAKGKIKNLNLQLDDNERIIWRQSADLDDVRDELRKKEETIEKLERQILSLKMGEHEDDTDQNPTSPPALKDEGSSQGKCSTFSPQYCSTPSASASYAKKYPDSSHRFHHDGFAEHLQICDLLPKESGEGRQSNSCKRIHYERMATCENEGRLECPPTKRCLSEDGGGNGDEEEEREGAHCHDTTVAAGSENSPSTNKYYLRSCELVKH